MKPLSDTCRISAMCKYLKMSASIFDYKAKEKPDEISICSNKKIAKVT